MAGQPGNLRAFSATLDALKSQKHPASMPIVPELQVPQEGAGGKSCIFSGAGALFWWEA
jgi:hypothetical protein